MQKLIPATLATLVCLNVFAGPQVTRAGLSITVPEGKWERSVGSCTGDWGWHRAGVDFTVGTRRYLKKDAEWHSSGDLYQIHSFDDIPAEVDRVMKGFTGQLKTAEKSKTPSGATILFMEFEGVVLRDAAPPARVLFAFREASDRTCAVEISCWFGDKEKELALQVFHAALKSLSQDRTLTQRPE